MSRISIPQTRRGLQIALGVVWLLAAALQFQPFMFGRGFALEILKPTAAGNPSFVAGPVLWSAHVVLAHPLFWNTVFAVTQLLLGLGLFWRRTVKAALAGTIVWSLIVWWLGEGLGGVLTGSAAPLMGAPGAVVLYAVLALLLWPRDGAAGRSPAETSILGRAAALFWVLIWGSEAYFALLPANDSSASLHGMLAGMAGGEPHPIGALDRLLASFVAHNATVGPTLGALFALCALAVLLPPKLAKPLYALAMVLAAITWIGQDFGGILTGQGTDPNSGPLLFLLAVAYWPIRPQPAAAAAIRRAPPRLRTSIAAAATALIAASSVAAATGLTTTAIATASTTGPPTRFTATSKHMLGPGPVLSSYQLAGYHILFHDTRNQATHPGLISIRLERRKQPVRAAKVQLTYRSLDMTMPTYTINLQPNRPGRYSHQGHLLGMGGRWRITITIQARHGPDLQLNLTDLISL